MVAPVTSAADDYNTIVASTVPVALTGNLLNNDINSAGTALSASLVSGPTSAQGTFTLNANGTYTFTPTTGFSGPVEIVYEVCSASPVDCAKATLHILVEPTPITPPDFAVTNLNTAISSSVATNDNVQAGTTYGQPAQNYRCNFIHERKWYVYIYWNDSR